MAFCSIDTQGIPERSYHNRLSLRSDTRVNLQCFPLGLFKSSTISNPSLSPYFPPQLGRSAATLRDENQPSVIMGSSTSRLHSVQTGTLDLFPEEVLDNIISFLAHNDNDDAFELSSLRGLYSVALTSSKFHRIALPHLYAKVPITLNKKLKFVSSSVDGGNGYSISTTSGCNATAFLRTLKDRPEIVPHVKSLHLKRDDVGFRERWSAGFYRWGDVMSLSHTQLCILQFRVGNDLQRIPAAQQYIVDHESIILWDLMRCLARIVHLDCTQYHTDSPFDPFTCHPSYAATLVPVPFEVNLVNLTTVKFPCRGLSLAFMMMWLTRPPNMQHIHLSNAGLFFPSPSLLDTLVKPQNCKLKVLELPQACFSGSVLPVTVENIIAAMLSIAPELETIKIGYCTPPPWVPNPSSGIASVVQKYSPRLKELTVEHCGKSEESPDVQ